MIIRVHLLLLQDSIEEGETDFVLGAMLPDALLQRTRVGSHERPESSHLGSTEILMFQLSQSLLDLLDVLPEIHGPTLLRKELAANDTLAHQVVKLPIVNPGLIVVLS